MDSRLLVTTQTQATLTTLDLGPLSGDYIAMQLVNASDTPGLDDIFVQWLGPQGEILMPIVQQPREGWQSIFMAQKLSIAASPATFTLTGHAGFNTSQIQYVRALAMRADAFASVDAQVTTTPVATMSPDVSFVNEVVPGGSNAASFFYVASSVGFEEFCGSVRAIRGMHVFVDTTDHAILHATDNCAYGTTYGSVGLLAGKPGRIATAVSAENNEGVIMDQSSVMLVGLP